MFATHLFSQRLATFGIIALTGLGVVGCVTQDEYRAMELKADDLADQLAETSRKAAEDAKLASLYRNQLGTIEQAEQSERALLANYETQIAEITGERDDLARRYEELVNKIGTGPALPAALTSELSSYAAQNPDLIEFDADRGIVKFKSDVTFLSGDAALKPEADQAIRRFAQILNSPVARSYLLEIEGHTDNVKSFSANTKAKGHKDNWYLSSHRAIAVAQGLMGQGIDAARVEVSGRADQDPVASNANAAGRAANRRVEVMILPQTVRSQEPAMQEAMPAAAEIEQESTPIDDSGSMK
jgi:chemotaxis protein MotB